MSEDDIFKGHSTSRALEQASGPVRVRPLAEQEVHEYHQARSIKVLDPAKLINSINSTYNY